MPNRQRKYIGIRTPKKTVQNQRGSMVYKNMQRKTAKAQLYICSKINGKNSQCQKTIKAATHYRLNQELIFLYVKKQKLNE
jgi:hypothetical protein